MSVLLADERTVLVRRTVKVTRYTILADGRTVHLAEVEAATVLSNVEELERGRVDRVNRVSRELEDRGVRVPVSMRVG